MSDTAYPRGQDCAGGQKLALTSLSTFRQRNVEREVGDVPDLPLGQCSRVSAPRSPPSDQCSRNNLFEHWPEGDRGRPRAPSEHSAGGMFRGRSEPFFDRTVKRALGGALLNRKFANCNPMLRARGCCIRTFLRQQEVSGNSVRASERLAGAPTRPANYHSFDGP